ncbi:20S proteasome subunit beta 6 [Nematocida homosporus]|uniref:20S proteasome subunit beta 6 n=1 Tax=Nematocida homosporus TaxID=1912981 RepID=UPI0022200B60|nr:20S proteasome subunit beta 6 [Nematocida homosporus]KAI5186099.1 20S proteasome subunit beta 6 [Nematocida homosporus]
MEVQPGIIRHGGSDNLYSDNSGTSLSILGRDFCVVAADTRHSAEYHINTRKATKIFTIGNMVLSATGFYADARSVYAQLKYTIENYEFNFSRPMPIAQAAAALHMILYSNRFFFKYAYCCLSGFTPQGIPKVYSYDPVGSYQETPCRCNGSGERMLQPLLDSWIKRNNWNCAEGKEYTPTAAETVSLIRDLYNGVAETDVKTGDALEVYVITNQSITRDEYPLRGD